MSNINEFIKQELISEIINDLTTIPGKSTSLTQVKLLVIDLLAKWEGKQE